MSRGFWKYMYSSVYFRLPPHHFWKIYFFPLGNVLLPLGHNTFPLGMYFSPWAYILPPWNTTLPLEGMISPFLILNKPLNLNKIEKGVPEGGIRDSFSNLRNGVWYHHQGLFLKSFYYVAFLKSHFALLCLSFDIFTFI